MVTNWVISDLCVVWLGQAEFSLKDVEKLGEGVQIQGDICE